MPVRMKFHLALLENDAPERPRTKNVNLAALENDAPERPRPNNEVVIGGKNISTSDISSLQKYIGWKAQCYYDIKWLPVTIRKIGNNEVQIQWDQDDPPSVSWVKWQKLCSMKQATVSSAEDKSRQTIEVEKIAAYARPQCKASQKAELNGSHEHIKAKTSSCVSAIEKTAAFTRPRRSSTKPKRERKQKSFYIPLDFLSEKDKTKEAFLKAGSTRKKMPCHNVKQREKKQKETTKVSM